MPKFLTPYDKIERKQITFTKIAQLEDAKNECDIGFIIENFVRTGQAPIKQGSYIDCTSVQSFEEAQQLVAEAYSMFESLPAKTRSEFKTVQNYLDYISDSKNLDDCLKKGYIDRATVPEEVLNDLAKVQSGANVSNKTSETQTITDTQQVNANS